MPLTVYGAPHLEHQPDLHSRCLLRQDDKKKNLKAEKVEKIEMSPSTPPTIPRWGVYAKEPIRNTAHGAIKHDDFGNGSTADCSKGTTLSGDGSQRRRGAGCEATTSRGFLVRCAVASRPTSGAEMALDPPHIQSCERCHQGELTLHRHLHQVYPSGSPYFFPRRQGHFIIMIFSRTEPQSQDSKKEQKIKGHAIPMLTQEKIRDIEKTNHWEFLEGWNGSAQDFITVSLPLL